MFSCSSGVAGDPRQTRPVSKGGVAAACSRAAPRPHPRSTKRSVELSEMRSTAATLLLGFRLKSEKSQTLSADHRSTSSVPDVIAATLGPANPLGSVDATVAPSLGARDPSAPALVVRAGDSGVEPTSGRRRIAHWSSPRTSPRQAQNSGRSGARHWPRDGWRAGMATSRNTRSGRIERSDEGVTTSRRLRDTRHSPNRWAVPRDRSGTLWPLAANQSTYGPL